MERRLRRPRSIHFFHYFNRRGSSRIFHSDRQIRNIQVQEKEKWKMGLGHFSRASVSSSENACLCVLAILKKWRWYTQYFFLSQFFLFMWCDADQCINPHFLLMLAEIFKESMHALPFRVKMVSKSSYYYHHCELFYD